jgi:hypothetical protein
VVTVIVNDIFFVTAYVYVDIDYLQTPPPCETRLGSGDKSPTDPFYSRASRSKLAQFTKQEWFSAECATSAAWTVATCGFPSFVEYAIKSRKTDPCS